MTKTAYDRTWDADKVATLKAGYDPDNSDASVAKLMETLNKSKRMVVGKLVSEKVYVAPEKPKAAKKDDGPTKGEILTSIKAKGFDIEGFDNATKAALSRLDAFLG